jgi:hypothetical protein
LNDRITISTGFCVVDGDCHLTNREIRMKANDAAVFAKNSGKNCVATFKGTSFRTEDLFVSSPTVPADVP